MIVFVSVVCILFVVLFIVKGDFVMIGVGLGLYNIDVWFVGSLFVIGGVWFGMNDGCLESVFGMVFNQICMQNDDILYGVVVVDVFKMFMGVVLLCYWYYLVLCEVLCNGDCIDVFVVVYVVGKCMLWVDGLLMIGSNQMLGFINDLVLIIVNNVVLDGLFQLNGMLVVQGNLIW